MELVTVINRTSKPLKGTWDGRHYDLAPGAAAYPIIQAEAFKRQNIKMGSFDPRTGEEVFLIGIKDYGDDCSPVEQSDAIERWDRSKLTGTRPTEVVPGDNGIYSVKDVQSRQPVDSNFVKP